MHTRIVSLYHEVVEFGISAKDYGVSGFSFDVKDLDGFRGLCADS